MRVEQLMTRIVHSCGPDDTLNRAAHLMWEHDCGCTPVVDAENHLVGIVTDRDIAMAAYTQGKRFEEIRIGNVMSRKTHTCGQTETLAIAEGRMRENQVRRLPVTDATGFLVGLISMNDLALEAKREQGARHPSIKASDVAETLASICRHRGHDQLMAAE